LDECTTTEHAVSPTSNKEFGNTGLASRGQEHPACYQYIISRGRGRNVVLSEHPDGIYTWTTPGSYYKKPETRSYRIRGTKSLKLQDTPLFTTFVSTTESRSRTNCDSDSIRLSSYLFFFLASSLLRLLAICTYKTTSS